MTPALAAGALLLLAAGAGKVADPTRTAGALAALGWRASSGLVRTGAVAEALVGAGALVVGGPVLAALVGLSYLGLAAFVVAALRSGTPIGTCGCFGRADTPPHPIHVVVDLALAAGALAATATGTTDPLLDARVPEIAAAVLVAATAFALLTRSPRPVPGTVEGP